MTRGAPEQALLGYRPLRPTSGPVPPPTAHYSASRQIVVISHPIEQFSRDSRVRKAPYHILTVDLKDHVHQGPFNTHLADIVTFAEDAILSKTLEGIVTSWNPGAERLFGYTPREMIGQSILRLIPQDRQEEEVHILRRLRAGQRIEHYETMRRKKDGGLVDVSLTISPLRSQAGEIMGASKIIRDITGRKQMEFRLRESEKQLRGLAENLERLVASRTSELSQSQEQLRALAAQLNLAEQKERQRLAGELHDYLGQMLALNRIKIGLAKKHPMEASLACILEEVQTTTDKALTYTRTLVSQLSPPVLQEFGLTMALPWLVQQMLERDLVVVLQLKTSMPSIPEDQALLLFQSIRELLLNCIKHAGVAEATVVLERHDKTLHVTVSDQGLGFDPSNISSVSQTKYSLPRYGLFSIRERMISMGGGFDLQTAPGKGTSARLIFPITTASIDHPPSPKTLNVYNQEVKSVSPRTGPSSATKVLLLIVDDHAMVRQGLCSLLEAYDDIQVVGEAGNGKEALELAQKLQPNIILMDVTMPDIDGIEVTKRIRCDHPHILVIGMSVHGAAQVERAMTNAGASAFIHKEAAVDHLHQTILAVRSRMMPSGQRFPTSLS